MNLPSGRKRNPKRKRRSYLLPNPRPLQREVTDMRRSLLYCHFPKREDLYLWSRIRRNTCSPRRSRRTRRPDNGEGNLKKIFFLRDLRALRGLLVLAFLFFTRGCLVGPNYQRPQIDTPQTWRVEDKNVQAITNMSWWEQYDDPILNELVKIALEENKDVKIATARIEQFLGLYPLKTLPTRFRLLITFRFFSMRAGRSTSGGS